MIPTEGNIQHVRMTLAFERFKVLRRVVRIVLLNINLLTFSPYVDVCLHLLHPFSSLIGYVALGSLIALMLQVVNESVFPLC